MEQHTYQLKGEELTVTIQKPEACEGTRFDRIGWVTQVRLETAGIDFCMPESRTAGQGTGGVGLSGEFGIDKPIGYDDAQVGETFMKLGIGALTKVDGEGYNFARTYPVEMYEVQVEAAPSEIRFTSITPEVHGYAARLTKTLTVERRSLKIRYKLENLGSRRISTNEYVHNFVSVGDYAVGPDYVLNLPYAPETKQIGDGGVEEKLVLSPGRLTWSSEAGGEYYVLYEGFAVGERPYWELIHTPSGAGMRELGDFDASKFAVWGAGHVVAPEVFVDLELAPGEGREWMRVYEFFA
ncbi:hypothetical protein B9G55_16470 [Saccharibacillus sp. O16]|nr:hypothetical protein B9G55_16470 [Saccharibacillus sp. O16]